MSSAGRPQNSQLHGEGEVALWGWGHPDLSLLVRISLSSLYIQHNNSPRDPGVQEAGQTGLCGQFISRTLWRKGLFL